MTQILPIELRHAELGEEGLRRALAAGHDPTDAQASVNYWYQRVADTFGRAASDHYDTYRRYGLRQHPNPELLARWQANVAPTWPSSPHRSGQEALTMRLESYAAGRWVPGHRPPGDVLAHAVTGEPVAEIDSTGLDFAAMLAPRPHRRRPGPAQAHLPPARPAAEGAGTAPDGAQGGVLRALQAHRRHAHRRLDRRRGRHRHAVRLRQQGPARAAQQHLPSRRRTRDALASGGSFVGQHICVPLEGAAVHINAFNFPCWGMLEKLAPTLLAGMPAIVKPASQTAYVAEADGPPDRRIRHPARGCAAADLRRHGRPVRAPDRPGRRHLHRLGQHRPPPARRIRKVVEQFGPLHDGGRLAQLLAARPRRRPRHARSSTSSSRRSRAR